MTGAVAVAVAAQGPKLGYASNGAGFWAHLKHFALPYMQFMYNEYGRGGGGVVWVGLPHCTLLRLKGCIVPGKCWRYIFLATR